MIQRAYRGDDARAWTTEAHLLGGQRTDAAGLAAVLDDPQKRLRAIIDDADAVIGCFVVERRPDGAGFGLFAVDPAHQGVGVGRRALHEAERLVSVEWHAPLLSMTVIRQRDDIIDWYERHGYSRTGATEAFPYGDVRLGEPKRDDLEFVVLAKDLPAPTG